VPAIFTEGYIVSYGEFTNNKIDVTSISRKFSVWMQEAIGQAKRNVMDLLISNNVIQGNM
jgi:hypothetical protein